MSIFKHNSTFVNKKIDILEAKLKLICMHIIVGYTIVFEKLTTKFDGVILNVYF